MNRKIARSGLLAFFSVFSHPSESLDLDNLPGFDRLPTLAYLRDQPMFREFWRLPADDSAESRELDDKDRGINPRRFDIDLLIMPKQFRRLARARSRMPGQSECFTPVRRVTG